jgi:hypothetical protein
MKYMFRLLELQRNRYVTTVVEKGVFEKRENDGINSSICFSTVKKRSKDATATSRELIPSFYRT